jgi:hypothetical protein
MASRSYIGDVWSLYKGLTLVRARILMSGTTPLLQKFSYPAGAPNSAALGTYSNASTSGGGTTWPSQYQQGIEGVRSVTRTNTGLWTFVLQDNFQRLLDMSVYQSLAGGAGTIVAVHENTTITSLGTAGGSTIGVALVDATANLADPATTTGVTITLALQNASEP